MTTTLDQAVTLLASALQERGLVFRQVNRREFLVHHATGQFSLSFLPGNCRTLISHASQIYPEHRGKGEGTKMLALREVIAVEAGVTLLLATVRNDNGCEIHLLKKAGWKRFTNNTTTGVSLWGKEL